MADLLREVQKWFIHIRSAGVFPAERRQTPLVELTRIPTQTLAPREEITYLIKRSDYWKCEGYSKILKFNSIICIVTFRLISFRQLRSKCYLFFRLSHSPALNGTHRHSRHTSCIHAVFVFRFLTHSVGSSSALSPIYSHHSSVACSLFNSTTSYRSSHPRESFRLPFFQSSLILIPRLARLVRPIIFFDHYFRMAFLLLCTPFILPALRRWTIFRILPLEVNSISLI